MCWFSELPIDPAIHGCSLSTVKKKKIPKISEQKNNNKRQCGWYFSGFPAPGGKKKIQRFFPIAKLILLRALKTILQTPKGTKNQLLQMANKITDVLISTALLWAVKIKVINTLMTQIMESGGKG